MKQYNIYNYRKSARGETGLQDYLWEPNPKKWEARRIRKIYHRPLHMQPPLYPTLIWLSHGIFNRGLPYTSVGKNVGRKAIHDPPWHYMRAQFYAIVVPFLFSLGTLVLVYLFCLQFFSYREGLLAILILVVSPLEIVVGSRLYADGILTFLTFLSLFLYLKSLRENCRRPLLTAGLAGTFLALSFLTKFSGVFFAFAFLIASCLNPNSRENLFSRLLDTRLIVAATLAFLIALPWNLLVYLNFGTFLPNTPSAPNNPWYRFVFNRPWYTYPLGTFWVLPATTLGWLSGFFSFSSPRKNFVPATFMIMSIFYTALYILFIYTGTAGVEHRYLMPIYPLLSILAGWGVVLVINFIKLPWLSRLSYIVVFVGIAYLGWRSLNIGLNNVFGNLVIFQPYGL